MGPAEVATDACQVSCYKYGGSSSPYSILTRHGMAMNSLDGMTLFRFAHMYKDASAGGMESYLHSLNTKLCERNELSIIQLYLSKEERPIREEVIGKGRVLWVPSKIVTRSDASLHLKNAIRKILQRPHRSEFIIHHERLLSLLQKNKPNLGVFHWISLDSKPIIDYFLSRQIPYVFINHFANSKFHKKIVKRQTFGCSAFGGVSSIGVPKEIQSKYTNLSDAIDTEFFHPNHSSKHIGYANRTILLHPSRLLKEKGHIDSLKVLKKLIKDGHDLLLIFAGRQDDRRYMAELKSLIKKHHIEEHILLTGELDKVELRNWYSTADIIILPSYSEGLGRVLLEAQAMLKPVVAYETGGVGEAIKSNVTGILVNCGDIEDMYQSISRLIKNKNRRIHMGKEGRSFVKRNFSLESLTEKHEQFYMNTLNGFKSVPK